MNDDSGESMCSTCMVFSVGWRRNQTSGLRYNARQKLLTYLQDLHDRLEGGGQQRSDIQVLQGSYCDAMLSHDECLLPLALVEGRGRMSMLTITQLVGVSQALQGLLIIRQS